MRQRVWLKYCLVGMLVSLVLIFSILMYLAVKSQQAIGKDDRILLPAKAYYQQI